MDRVREFAENISEKFSLSESFFLDYYWIILRAEFLLLATLPVCIYEREFFATILFFASWKIPSLSALGGFFTSFW